MRNKAINVKTCVKKAETAVTAKDAAAAKESLSVAISRSTKQVQKVFITKICARKTFNKAVNAIANYYYRELMKDTPSCGRPFCCIDCIKSKNSKVLKRMCKI